MKTTAAVLHNPDGQLSLETVTLDEPRDDEIIVRVEACGICQMDIEARQMLPTPSVLGHEGAGIIEQVGKGVRDLRLGQRVIMSYAWCGHCPQCRDNKPYICDESWSINFSGTRFDGSATLFLDQQPLTAAFFQQSSFARHVITPAQNVVAVDIDDIPPHFLAALPCGVLTGAGTIANTLNVQRGKGLIVFGAGTVGLSAIMAARIRGAEPIFAVDIHQDRLDLATELGATHVINALESDVSDEVHQCFPTGVHYAVETSSNAHSFNAAIDCVEIGGQVAITSLPHPMEDFSFQPYQFYTKAASLHAVSVGSAVAKNFIPQMLRWHRDGQFPFDKLVTSYAFEDINQACADVGSGKTVKAVLTM
jgi:aryl-alcohol dehydrogenase